MFELEELKNRYKHECLPLPLLYALQNPEVKEKISNLIMKKKMNEEDISMLVDLAMSQKEVQKLQKKMKSVVRIGIEPLNIIKQDKEILKLLLNSSIEDL